MATIEFAPSVDESATKTFATAPSTSSAQTNKAVVYDPSADLGESKWHQEISQLTRSVNRQERKTDQYIEEIQSKSEAKLKKRSKLHEQESELELLREKQTLWNTELRTKFFVEVDQAFENKSQDRILLQFHKLHTEISVPAWVKRLKSVVTIATKFGHNNKTLWRSQCLSELKNTLSLAYDDECAEIARENLRTAILNINTVNANQMIESLKKIKDMYIESTANDERSIMARHSKQLQETRQRISKSEVPLARSMWSDTLSEMNFTVHPDMSEASQNSQFFSPNQSIRNNKQTSYFQEFSQHSSTISTFLEPPLTLSSDTISEKFEQTVLAPQPRKDVGERHPNIQVKALIRLRAAAGTKHLNPHTLSLDGNFELAWAIFRKSFDIHSFSLSSKSLCEKEHLHRFTGASTKNFFGWTDGWTDGVSSHLKNTTTLGSLSLGSEIGKIGCDSTSPNSQKSESKHSQSQNRQSSPSSKYTGENSDDSHNSGKNDGVLKNRYTAVLKKSRSTTPLGSDESRDANSDSRRDHNKGDKGSRMVKSSKKKVECANDGAASSSFSVSSQKEFPHKESATAPKEPKLLDRYAAMLSAAATAKKKLPPGYEAPRLVVFRLLMTAVKNSIDPNFDDAETTLNALYANGLKPDISMFNIMMGACVKSSKWRRGIRILHEMYQHHGLLPNSATFDILLNSVRHSLEEPGVIYETLRLEKLPRDYCYKAAVINAGNRLSAAALNEVINQISKFPNLTDGFSATYPPGCAFAEPEMNRSNVSLPPAIRPKQLKRTKPLCQPSPGFPDQLRPLGTTSSFLTAGTDETEVGMEDLPVSFSPSNSVPEMPSFATVPVHNNASFSSACTGNDETSDARREGLRGIGNFDDSVELPSVTVERNDGNSSWIEPELKVGNLNMNHKDKDFIDFHDIGDMSALSSMCHSTVSIPQAQFTDPRYVNMFVRPNSPIKGPLNTVLDTHTHLRRREVSAHIDSSSWSHSELEIGSDVGFKEQIFNSKEVIGPTLSNTEKSFPNARSFSPSSKVKMSSNQEWLAASGGPKKSIKRRVLDKMRWKGLAEAMRNTLPVHSPAKLSTTHSSTSFEVQLKKQVHQINKGVHLALEVDRAVQLAAQINGNPNRAKDSGGRALQEAINRCPPLLQPIHPVRPSSTGNRQSTPNNTKMIPQKGIGNSNYKKM